MENPIVFEGTIGADLVLTTHVDLVTDVQEGGVKIAVRKPSGTEVTWIPDSVDSSDPLNCVIHYRTVPGDLDEGGNYRLQPIVTMTDGSVWYLKVALWEITERFEGI